MRVMGDQLQQRAGLSQEQHGKLEQMKAQYQSLLNQFSKLQGECRDAFRREEDAKKQVDDAEVENQRLFRERTELRRRLDLAGQEKQNAIAQEKQKLVAREENVSLYEQKIRELEETVTTLQLDSENRARDRQRAEEAMDEQIEQQERQIKELERLNDSLQEQVREEETRLQQAVAEREHKIQQLSTQVSKMELDVEAMKVSAKKRKTKTRTTNVLAVSRSLSHRSMDTLLLPPPAQPGLRCPKHQDRPCGLRSVFAD